MILCVVVEVIIFISILRCGSVIVNFIGVVLLSVIFVVSVLRFLFVSEVRFGGGCGYFGIWWYFVYLFFIFFVLVLLVVDIDGCRSGEF